MKQSRVVRVELTHFFRVRLPNRIHMQSIVLPSLPLC